MFQKLALLSLCHFGKELQQISFSEVIKIAYLKGKKRVPITQVPMKTIF